MRHVWGRAQLSIETPPWTPSSRALLAKIFKGIPVLVDVLRVSHGTDVRLTLDRGQLAVWLLQFRALCARPRSGAMCDQGRAREDTRAAL